MYTGFLLLQKDGTEKEHKSIFSLDRVVRKEAGASDGDVDASTWKVRMITFNHNDNKAEIFLNIPWRRILFPFEIIINVLVRFCFYSNCIRVYSHETLFTK